MTSMKLIMENFKKFLAEQEQQPTRKLIFLVGPPAVGKSTWIKDNADIVGNHVTINRDDLIEKFAGQGAVKTYDDFFNRPPKQLMAKVKERAVAKFGKEQAEAMFGEELEMPSKEEIEAESEKVSDYLELLPPIAKEYNQRMKKENPDAFKKLGEVKPFDMETLKSVAVKHGVPTKIITPFSYTNLDDVEKKVTDELSNRRSDAIAQNKNIVIDMTNINTIERDLHRKQIAAVLTGKNEDKVTPEEAKEVIEDNFVQHAYVFAPDERGYDDESLKKNIKNVAVKRAEEIKAEVDPVTGLSTGRSKTIPPGAYDAMFRKYEPPTREEGYEVIEYVGVPSLEKPSSEEPAGTEDEA